MDLTNYYEHPGNPNYVVFRFRDKKFAQNFEKKLNDNNIPFEKDVLNSDNQVITTLFGVKKTYYKKALHENFITYSELRKPFISDPILRYFVLSLTILFLILAFVGHFFS